MILQLRTNYSLKVFSLILAALLLALFLSFLLFEVFDIDGSNNLAFYWLEDCVSMELQSLHKPLSQFSNLLIHFASVYIAKTILFQHATAIAPHHTQGKFLPYLVSNISTNAAKRLLPRSGLPSDSSSALS